MIVHTPFIVGELVTHKFENGIDSTLTRRLGSTNTSMPTVVISN